MIESKNGHQKDMCWEDIELHEVNINGGTYMTT